MIVRASWVAAALAVAGCGGPEALELPADPVDRAATCGVVAAAAARTETDVNSPLSLAAQGRILHHAMLGAAEGGEFDKEKASRASKRMAELRESVTAGKWSDLSLPCAAAYPVAAKTEIELPAGRLDAQLACEELADFVTVAMEAQEKDYGNELAEFRRFRTKLNEKLGPGLRARAGASLEAQGKERSKALAAATQLGSPIAVLAECRKRFS